MSPHIERGHWPVLLSCADAEADAALAHAKECPDCERERVAAQAFLSQLSALPALPGPSAAVLAAAQAPILADLELGDAVTKSVAISWEASASGAAFLVLVAVASRRTFDARSLFWAGGLLLVGFAVLRRSWWAGLVAAAVAAWALSGTLDFEVGHGMRCAGVELFAAVLPLGALWFVVRRGVAASSSDFIRAGIGGALAGQAALALTCPSHSLGHLLVFHSLVVMVAGLMGAAVGRLQSGLVVRP